MLENNLFLLGSPRFQRQGRSITPDTRKATALLAYLAVTEQSHSRDSLAALFYPDADETHARGALRRTLSALNKILGENGLRTTRDSVELIASPALWIDVRELETLLAEAERHPHRSLETCVDCLARLERCTVLYRGDFLSGFSLRDSPAFDDWQFFQAETLRRLFATALERLARAYRARDEMGKAIEYARRWLALDPLLEDAHRELMLCYAQAGQRNAALRQYQECARILDKELGVEPLDETRRLYRDIFENKLVFQSLNRANFTEDDEFRSRLHTSQLAIPAARRSPNAPYPLIGRTPELEKLVALYRDRAPQGYFAAIEGEPGIGKTRLAEEFLTLVNRQGGITLTANCYAGENGLAYAPFIELLQNLLNETDLRKLESLAPSWLSEAARLAPELRRRIPTLPETGTLDNPGAQSLFFEGLRQVLGRLAHGLAPAVLFIDDIHWADSASIDLLAYLVRRLSGFPWLILVTWRDEDLPIQSELRSLLAEAQRAGSATGFRLKRLDAGDVAELTQQIKTDRFQLPTGFNERLYRESEGLPLLLMAYLGAINDPLQAKPSRELAPDGSWELPENARDLLKMRFSTLDSLSSQLLAAAAVIGRSFEFDILAAAGGRSETETVSALEALLARGLIQECGSCDSDHALRYDFSHEKLRAMVYADTSLVRRRLLHRRVAEALVEQMRRPGATASLAGQIAHHFQESGLNGQAAQYFRQAGEVAMALFANRQALEHFQRAIALGPPDLCVLNESVGDLHILLGEYPQALDAFRRAADCLPAGEAPRLAHKMGTVYQRRGDWAAAIARYRFALAADPPPPPALYARIQADWSLAAYQNGQPDDGFALAQEALQNAKKADDAAALAQAYNLLGIFARKHSDFETARQALVESLDISRRRGDLPAQAAALNNLALLCGESGSIKESIDYTKDALLLCERIGDRHRAAALHNNLADLYHLTGRPEQAMEHLKQAVTLFAQIGSPATTLEPEIWKLTEW